MHNLSSEIITVKNEIANEALQSLARKCIHDHRHPIVKVSLPPNKFFLPAKDETEKSLINDYQDKLSFVLEHQRVEKRSSRAQAIWLPDKKVAKVTKIVKNLVKYFGYQNKDGVFLHPEEILYLLETNKLEVMWADSPLSIENAYELVLKTPPLTLSKYKVYKKLATLGYKLIRFDQIQSGTKKNEAKRCAEPLSNSELPELKKLKHQEDELEGNKSSYLATSDLHLEKSVTEQEKYIANISNHIRANMPSDSDVKLSSENPDYCVFSPMNTLKSIPDFNLYMCEEHVIERKHFNNNIQNIYAICADDVAFYRFNEFHLPAI